MNVKEIFSIKDNVEFEKKALEIFEFQYYNLPLYKEFCTYLKKMPNSVKAIEEIPFLPINFFKTHRISTRNDFDLVFESSGTTNSQTSKHYVADISIYEQSFKMIFNSLYGEQSQYLWIALMPDKKERPNSSLIYMVDNLMNSSVFPESGFYLGKEDKLYRILIRAIENNTPVIFIGLTYALIDFAEKFKLPENNNIIVIETGGMKGKRKEIIRKELHSLLKSSFKVNAIHSEYGMTELLSQSYSTGEEKFKSPTWKKILIRDIYNPKVVGLTNFRGGVNVIDLANVYSCSFIETEDLGIAHNDGTFEILGRIDTASIRGCNIMID